MFELTQKCEDDGEGRKADAKAAECVLRTRTYRGGGAPGGKNWPAVDLSSESTTHSLRSTQAAETAA